MALIAGDLDERARRAQRLGVIEATFDPLPLDASVAREWGRLAAAVADRVGKPRRRAVDLAIAATANVHEVPLLTADAADLAIIDDLTEVRALDARVLPRTSQAATRILERVSAPVTIASRRANVLSRVRAVVLGREARRKLLAGADAPWKTRWASASPPPS